MKKNTKNKSLVNTRTFSTLENSIADEMSAEIAREIDWEITCELLEQWGWTRVTLNNHPTKQKTQTLKDWTEVNCKSKVKSLGNLWMFEQKSDAAWFMLRWL